MTDIFIKKSRWFDFANEHNKKANVDATLLNGSKSYTLAAIHLAAGKSIPLSIRLDTARKKGVANHFNGLRQFYESDIGEKSWLREIVEGCQKFADENALDSDEMIKKIIEWTERNGHGTEVVEKTDSQKNNAQSHDSGKIPTKEELEMILRRNALMGKEIDENVFKSTVETDFTSNGRKLHPDWWEIIKRKFKEW